MNILIRQMKPEEAVEVTKIGKKAFGVLEGLFLTKQKEAIVAVDGDNLLGGVYYSMGKQGGKKFGKIDYIFTAPAVQGRGAGKLLCKAAVKHLWEQGCDYLLTYIRDDNVASWGLFIDNGFVRTDFLKLIKGTGLLGAVRQYFLLNSFIFSLGHEMYIAMPSTEQTTPLEKPKTV